MSIIEHNSPRYERASNRQIVKSLVASQKQNATMIINVIIGVAAFYLVYGAMFTLIG